MYICRTYFLNYFYRIVGPILRFFNEAVNWAQGLLVQEQQVNPLSVGDSVPLRDCPPGETRSGIRGECRRPLTPG